LVWNCCIGLIVLGIGSFLVYAYRLGAEMERNQAIRRQRRIPPVENPGPGKLVTLGILRTRATSLISPFEWGWSRLPGSRLPPDRRAELGLPMLDTIEEILEFLQVGTYSELVLLADANALSAHGGPEPRAIVPVVPAKLENYLPKRIPKRGGGERLLLVPKPKLKAAQHRILRGILGRIPPHPAARGFAKGRDLVDHVSMHTRQRVVLTWDIELFFPSIHYARVHRVFAGIGYSPKAAHILALLCTTRSAEKRRPWKRSLPQGAPTSPALSNLVCRRMDGRLDGLAKKFGARYTRYADDLAFSGDEKFRKELGRFIRRLRDIISESQFVPNQRKLWVMRSGGRQIVTDLVVNNSPAVPREEVDRLRAIIHNAMKAGGLASQNRSNHPAFRDHLLGRIAWVARFKPTKAEKLRRMLEAVPAEGGGSSPAPSDSLTDAPPGELPDGPPAE